MEIVRLAERPELIETLAAWHFAEWADLYPGWTLEACRADLLEHCDLDRIPTTLVALEDETPIGCVSLLIDDGLPGHVHLSPWLASLYVLPARRGVGLGEQLLAAATAEARRLGVQRLYLFTPAHCDYYAARGWTAVGSASAGGTSVVVMSRAIEAA